jgi:enamine deaminase RidA (YjgF/YER057c/UK114 family)
VVKSSTCKHAAQHQNPVPNAAIHRGVIVTLGILGKDLETDTYPPGRAHQVDLAFTYLEAILAEAGATVQDVVKLGLFAGQGRSQLDQPPLGATLA